jgi:hypothetical protein
MRGTEPDNHGQANRLGSQSAQTGGLCMNQSLNQPECQRTPAAAALDITALALKQGATHMALAAAREAARSILLAFAGAPHRLAGGDLDMLRQMAASSPQQLAGRLTERRARIRAVLVILDRLLPQPRRVRCGSARHRPDLHRPHLLFSRMHAAPAGTWRYRRIRSRRSARRSAAGQAAAVRDSPRAHDSSLLP